MLLRCRLTALNIAVLKSVQSTSMSLWIISPPSTESLARGCPHAWGRVLPARGSGRSLAWKRSPLSPRDKQDSRHGVNFTLLHEIQPFGSDSPHASVMRAWHSHNLMLLHGTQPLGSELFTCIKADTPPAAKAALASHRTPQCMEANA